MPIIKYFTKIKTKVEVYNAMEDRHNILFSVKQNNSGVQYYEVR